jgi:hypothetical protein
MVTLDEWEPPAYARRKGFNPTSDFPIRRSGQGDIYSDGDHLPLKGTFDGHSISFQLKVGKQEHTISGQWMRTDCPVRSGWLASNGRSPARGRLSAFRKINLPRRVA